MEQETRLELATSSLEAMIMNLNSPDAKERVSSALLDVLHPRPACVVSHRFRGGDDGIGEQALAPLNGRSVGFPAGNEARATWPAAAPMPGRWR
jgi:hypothetical protein